jgi:hypothetical protein
MPGGELSPSSGTEQSRPFFEQQRPPFLVVDSSRGPRPQQTGRKSAGRSARQGVALDLVEHRAPDVFRA